MFHVRRYLNKQERKEYQQWVDSYKINSKSLSKVEKIRTARRFYIEQAKLNDHRNTKHIPSLLKLTPFKEQQSLPVHYCPDCDCYPCQCEDMQVREEAAQREIEQKKLRVAPVFNKGGYQFYSDDMIQSMLDGRHRRR